MRIKPLLLALPLILVACDSDGDGLSNSEEETWGSDPEVADSDGDGINDGDEVHTHGTDPVMADSDDDGLNDGDEISAGTDPLNGDSDGDGYPDGAEADAGSDPTDASDLLYEGGWPFNAFKDDIEGGDITAKLKKGEIAARYIGFDQFGDEVDLFDFANQGRPVLLDIAAKNCGPCQAMSLWSSGSYPSSSMGLSDAYDAIPEAVANGDILWVTVLYRDYTNGAPANQSRAEKWDENYPNEMVPVLSSNHTGEDTMFEGDEDVDYSLFAEHVGVKFWPWVMLFDENMELVSKPSSSSWAPPLEEALNYLNGGWE